MDEFKITVEKIVVSKQKDALLIVGHNLVINKLPVQILVVYENYFIEILTVNNFCAGRGDIELPAQILVTKLPRKGLGDCSLLFAYDGYISYKHRVREVDLPDLINNFSNFHL